MQHFIPYAKGVYDRTSVKLSEVLDNTSVNKSVAIAAVGVANYCGHLATLSFVPDKHSISFMANHTTLAAMGYAYWEAQGERDITVRKVLYSSCFIFGLAFSSSIFSQLYVLPPNTDMQQVREDTYGERVRN